MQKLEIRYRNRMTLVLLEIVLVSIITGYQLVKRYDLDTFTGIVIGIVTMMVVGVLFFRVRVFRYVFSILFSIIWGIIVFQIAKSLTDISITHWVAFALAIIFSLFWHKDYFDFERKN